MCVCMGGVNNDSKKTIYRERGPLGEREREGDGEGKRERERDRGKERQKSANGL